MSRHCNPGPRRVWLLGVAIVAATSCHRSLMGPEAIESSLHLSDSEVTFGETFAVRLTVENHSDLDVSFSSAMSCLALPSVYRGGERLDWDGTALGCLAAVGRHVVPARDSLVVEFELRAALRGGGEAPGYDARPEPGVYEVRMDSYVGPVPDLTAELLVTG